MNQASLTTPCAVAASNLLSTATEGRYGIEVFPASSLGKETGINESLTFGTVDIIYTSQSFASCSYGEIAIGGAPFMFRDFDHWDKYRKSDLFQELVKGYSDATKNHITAMTYYGSRHVTSNKPILTPDDMVGLKIRVPNAPLYMMFPQATDLMQIVSTQRERCSTSYTNKMIAPEQLLEITL